MTGYSDIFDTSSRAISKGGAVLFSDEQALTLLRLLFAFFPHQQTNSRLRAISCLDFRDAWDEG